MRLERLFEYEKKINHEVIKARGFSIWPMLRIAIFSKYEKRNNVTNNSEHNRKQSLVTSLFRVHTLFKMLTKKSYWFISDNSELKEIEGRLVDRSFLKFQDITEGGAYLRIEKRVPGIPLKLSKYTVDYYALTFLCRVVGLFINRANLSSSCVDEIEKTLNEFNIEYKYVGDIERFYRQYVIYKLLLRISRPVLVLFNCSYCYFPLVKAANDLGIKTYEVQHGIIHNLHYGYVTYTDLDPSFFPNILGVYTNSEKEILKRSNFFKTSKIEIIGNSYLDILKGSKLKTSDLSNNICITLQTLNESEFIPIVINVASCLPDFNFIIVPRVKDQNNYLMYDELPENVKFNFSEDFYSVLLKSTIHCTVSSTCAIEAQYLGIPNIIYELNGDERRIFSGLLYANNVNVYVNTTEKFISAIEENKNNEGF